MVLEEVFKNWNSKKSGIQIDGEHLDNRRFADDNVSMSESTGELPQMIMQLHRESQKVSLKMNIKKTKVMFSNNMRYHKLIIDNEVDGMCQEMYILRTVNWCMSRSCT